MTPAYEIGKFYEVPCIQWTYCSRFDWWPVLGPKHEDVRIIGFLYEHYHVDMRFLTREQDAWINRSRFRSFHAAFSQPIHSGTKDFTRRKKFRGIECNDPLPEVTLKRRKCIQQWDGYPVMPPWMSKLEDAYECARMVKGVCPHQGAPLDGLKVVDGVVTCPLHGLRWNVETGELVRVTESKAKREAREQEIQHALSAPVQQPLPIGD